MADSTQMIYRSELPRGSLPVMMLRKAQLTVLLPTFFFVVLALPPPQIIDERDVEVKSRHQFLNGTIPLDIGLKVGETIISVLSLVLVAATFVVLANHADYLVNTSKIPFPALKDNIGEILERSWPDLATDQHITWPEPPRHGKSRVARKQQDSKNDAIKLLYVGQMGFETEGCREAKGLLECSERPANGGDTVCSERSSGANVLAPANRLWLTKGSEATRALVQLAIWEWLSFYLMAGTLSTTLIYNGFTGHELGSDAIPRLVVVGVYTLFYLVHFLFVWCMSFPRYLTQVSVGAAWNFLHGARFAVVNREQFSKYNAAIKKGLSFIEIDQTAEEVRWKLKTYNAKIHGRFPDPKIWTAESTKDVDDSLRVMKKEQDNARDNVKKAAQSALERVFANALAMLGICVTTGFATYTSKPLADNNSAQIGSLALLASVLVGISSMLSSYSYLSAIHTSFEEVQNIKELRINIKSVDWYGNVRNPEGVVAFTRKNSLTRRKVNICDLLKAMSWGWRFFAIFLGPAYALLPTKKDNERCSRDAFFDLNIRVRTRNVVLQASQQTVKRDVEVGPTQAINVYSADPDDRQDCTSWHLQIRDYLAHAGQGLCYYWSRARRTSQYKESLSSGSGSGPGTDALDTYTCNNQELAYLSIPIPSATLGLLYETN